MKIFLKKIVTLFFFIGITFPCISYAGEDLTISLEPKNPAPYTETTLTLVSYSFSLNTSLITWSRGGKTVLSGFGEKRLRVMTGAVGELLPVHVHVVTADNISIELDITITPKSVNLLYEVPESYVPTFYEGKALPGEGAFVRFVALPNISEGGRMVPPSMLSYSWYVNNTYVDESSGTGKQVAILRLDYLSTYTRVKVVVRSPRGEVAEKSIDVYPHEVMPLLYQHDPLFGSNLTSLIIRRFEATKDFTLSLEPFFVSMVKGSSPSYLWLLGGLPSTPADGRLLSFHPKENSYGTKMLNITVNNPKRINQEGKTAVELIFDTRK